MLSLLGFFTLGFVFVAVMNRQAAPFESVWLPLAMGSLALSVLSGLVGVVFFGGWEDMAAWNAQTTPEPLQSRPAYQQTPGDRIYGAVKVGIMIAGIRSLLRK